MPQKVNWKERVLTPLSNPYPSSEFLIVKLERLDEITGAGVGGRMVVGGQAGLARR